MVTNDEFLIKPSKLLFQMVINSFTILDIDMNSIGTGIYLAASILDHSCNPNAVATFDGKTISIRATKDLTCLDWSQVFHFLPINCLT